MNKEKLFSGENSNEPPKNAIIGRVADFFSSAKKIERTIESEPFATIIDLDPYLALDLLKLGEDQPNPRDAYAKGVADGVASIIELYSKFEDLDEFEDLENDNIAPIVQLNEMHNKEADIIPISKEMGRFALKDTTDFDNN
ncbi:MAG: hypothetical protein WCI37_01165 [bacterium]|jgi:hypothetical protein